MMKKTLMALALLLSLTLAVPTAAAPDKGKPTTVETVADDTDGRDEIEAYSDTTDVATDDSTVAVAPAGVQVLNTNGTAILDTIMNELDADDILGMLFVLAILMIMFVLAPIGIIGVCLYFVHKNRKEKMRLAQMAMQNGQQIPSELLTEPKNGLDDAYQSGIRQLFLGIGLMVFLGYTGGQIGFGVGVLVFCMGLGKVVIARTSAAKNNNPSNIQNYE